MLLEEFSAPEIKDASNSFGDIKTGSKWDHYTR
jgi:hypothetical protein